MPRLVHVLAFDNAQVLDVTGPLQVFASANDLARQRGLPLPYAVTVIADQAQPVMTSAGLALVAEPLPAVDQPCDTLLIAGAHFRLCTEGLLRLISYPVRALFRRFRHG